MGKAWSTVKRPIMNYNIENRAHRYLEKQQRSNQPKPPPSYPSQPLSASSKDPNILKEILSKNEDLVENIDANITITSTDPPEPPKSNRTLPQKGLENPAQYWELDFRFYEPENGKIPRGRLSFKEATDIFNLRYQNSGGTNSTTVPSHEAANRVDSEKLERMLKYFAPFEHEHRGYELWNPWDSQSPMLQARSKPEEEGPQDVFTGWDKLVDDMIDRDEKRDKEQWEKLQKKRNVEVAAIKEEVQEYERLEEKRKRQISDDPKSLDTKKLTSEQ